MYTRSLLSPGDAWHRPHESAMPKLDDTKMLTRIAEARTAILDRAEDILTHSSGQSGSPAMRPCKLCAYLQAVARKKSAA